MRTSIVMATFNRATLLSKTLESFVDQEYKDYEVVVVDDGNDDKTEALCERYRFVKYVKLDRPQDKYKNQAYPLNVAIRHSSGDTLIIQNPECKHVSKELIFNLTEKAGLDKAVFASALSLTKDGAGDVWYCHPDYNQRPFFFCGSLHRRWLESLRGFDEDFKSYGYEDDDFAYRLKDAGCRFAWPDGFLVHHQWHGSSGDGVPWNTEQYEEKLRMYREGKIGIERNPKGWGGRD